MGVKKSLLCCLVFVLLSSCGPSAPKLKTYTTVVHEQNGPQLSDNGKINLGCNLSWFTGWDMKASDFLESGKNRSYSPDNVCDQNWRTAWVENAAGFGKGEKVEFIFRDKDGQKTDPTLTLGVASFFNGYIKSEKTWKENNRVKTLGVLYNGKKIFTIHLSDTMFHQTVLFDPVKIKPGVSLGFEIEEVYPGEKYDDTVITEILFEDGNCLGETGE